MRHWTLFFFLSLVAPIAHGTPMCDKNLLAVEQDLQSARPDFHTFEFNQISDSVNPRYFGVALPNGITRGVNLKAVLIHEGQILSQYQMTPMLLLKTNVLIFDVGEALFDRFNDYMVRLGTVQFSVVTDAGPLCELRVPFFGDPN